MNSRHGGITRPPSGSPGDGLDVNLCCRTTSSSIATAANQRSVSIGRHRLRTLMCHDVVRGGFMAVAPAISRRFGVLVRVEQRRAR